MSSTEIAAALLRIDVGESRVVVVTGGEPALQWDAELANTLKNSGFSVHMESNGTVELGAAVDWLTVSPKPQFHTKQELVELRTTRPNECKVVVDSTVTRETLLGYERRYRGAALFLQPCMDDDYEGHLQQTLQFIERRPAWRLSLQLHKIVGLP